MGVTSYLWPASCTFVNERGDISAKETAMTGCIVGWAHTPFGRLDTESVESLVVRVATDALADAGIAPADVDEIVLGHFNAGFSAQDFTASLVLQASDDLRFKLATHVENACATGCSLVSDGAAAVVLADVETALQMKKAVAFRAAAHVQDFLPMAKRDILKFEGCTQAWQRALAQAGIALTDLSFVETHDCFTVAELIEYEAMGLVPEGQGARAVAEGWTQKDGKLPVNPSGGLKAKGHPIGATGVSMHALTAMQLCGSAGDIQVKNAR